jgi:membrane-associated phospholipid phosphatase
MAIWPLLTRLGEAEILLPVALCTALLLLVQRDTRRQAGVWMALLFVAALLTTLSKLAFIGWGLGLAAIDFTGVSGHAMFSSAIYPLLLRCYVGNAARGVSPTVPIERQGLALLWGAAVALLVGVSRIVIGAHSFSEVLAGWLLGAGVTLLVLRHAGSGGAVRVRPMLWLVLGAWLAAMPVHLQPSQTHSMVTQLALTLSGRVLPYTRSDMLRGTDKQDLR